MSAKEKGFDPRRSSAVVINYNEKLPGQSLLIKSAELPVKTFVVGPHKQQRTSHSTSRPASAPHGRPGHEGPAHTDHLAPRFLDAKGRWIASELPEQPRPTQAQPLTASATATAEVVNTLMPKQRGAVRPVSAVHTFNDVSPVITGEFVREAGGTAHMSYTVGGTAMHPGRQASPRSILDSSPHSPQDSPRGNPAPQMHAPPPARQPAAPTPKPASPAHKYRPSSAGQVPQVFYGTSPYPGGYHASLGNYKDVEAVKNDLPANGVSHKNMYYYRHAEGRTGKATRPASSGGPYLTGSQSARTVQLKSGFTRSLDAGTIKHGETCGRGAATTQWQRTQHGAGDYMVNMMQTNDADGVKVGTVYKTTRNAGSQPRNTGHWTSLEPQAGTKLKAGRLGTPLEHPFSRDHATNAEPYFGGQYTVRRDGQHGQYDYQDVDGNAKGASVKKHNYFTHGSAQSGSGAAGGGQGYNGNTNADGPFAAAAGNPYWDTQANLLAAPDLARAEKEVLGKGVVAGSANARLVGGHWKYIPRPVEGDVVYTDYYGPCGKEHANYYGRSYAVNTTEFAQNRLVSDSAYQKVQASMMGIQALRDRPGLSMGSQIVHGEPEQLNGINQANQSHKTRHLHHIDQYHNLRPEQHAWVA